ncbi:MAG: hypothetical protein WAU68_15620 [Vitreimonas sp.]
MVRHNRGPVPARFGDLHPTHGLVFTCAACSRSTSFLRNELVRRWGEEGLVKTLVARLGCSNCNAKRRRRAPLSVGVFDGGRSASEQRRANLRDPLDTLVFDIENLKPRRKIS